MAKKSTLANFRSKKVLTKNDMARFRNYCDFAKVEILGRQKTNTSFVQLYIPSKQHRNDKPIPYRNELIKVVKTIIARNFGGYTVTRGMGGWLKDGILQEEKVVLVKSYTKRISKKKIIHFYDLSRFIANIANQNAISLELKTSNSEATLRFISANNKAFFSDFMLEFLKPEELYLLLSIGNEVLPKSKRQIEQEAISREANEATGDDPNREPNVPISDEELDLL